MVDGNNLNCVLEFNYLGSTISSTVEPLVNDHPHLRPPAFYDRFLIDGMSTLYKRPLTNDHPADVTNDHGNLNFTPDELLSLTPAELMTIR